MVIFAWVFLDQIGLPLTSLPILLAAGAMAGAGTLSFLGATSLVSKFVPGLNAVASPLAGMSGMRRFHFLAWNAVGSALFAGVLVGLGHLFSRQLEQVSALASRSGSWLLAGSGVAFGVYLLKRYGIHRVRPLAGGFNAWAGKGFLLASEECAEQAEPDLSVKEYSAKPEAVAVNGSIRICDVQLGRGNCFTAGDDDGIVRCDG